MSLDLQLLYAPDLEGGSFVSLYSAVNFAAIFSNISSGAKVELAIFHVAMILGISRSAITVAQDVIMQSASHVAVLGNRYADVAQLRQEIGSPFA